MDDYNPDDEFVEDEFGDGYIVLTEEEWADWTEDIEYVR